jgi:N-acetylglutamate synthase-like GNAT family acetyltransferase
VRGFEKFAPADVGELTAFLTAADLTIAGLDDPRVRLWLLRDASGALVGSTGFEISADGDDVIVRSVAVAAEARGTGLGTRLALHALERARAEGARRAWLFSRRSGPFWRGLGFEPADRDELAAALATTQQVRLFVSTGQLGREIAWRRPLDAAGGAAAAPA